MNQVLTQAFNSKLSKKGKTTTTGVFEGQPQNALVGNRNYTTPTAVEKVQAPLDISFNNKVFESDTYLDYLNRNKRI